MKYFCYKFAPRIIWYLRFLMYKIFIVNWSGFSNYLGKPLIFLMQGSIVFGNRLRILPGMRLEMHDKNAKLSISHNVSIGNNFHLICANDITIESDVTISANVFIADSDNDYTELDVPVINQRLIKNKIFIGKNTFIGYGAVILPGTSLGKQCIVGANSVVKGRFPDRVVIAGAPAKILKKYSFDKKEWVAVTNNEEL